ncbi:MAG TPA: glycosyltransferase family 39 protein [Sphingobium sp.]
MTGRSALPPVERIYLILLALCAAAPAGFLLAYILAAIPFPYGLDYNEGIVWQQMNDIVAGRGYAPIGGFPAIVYHYPPVYHLLSAAIAGLGVDPLSAGRIVSLTATAGSTIIVMALTKPWLGQDFSRGQRIVAMAGAAICTLGCQGVQDWTPLMRVDPLACFLALLGLWLVVQAVERPALIYWAGVVFVLSVFTKQNSVLTAAAGLGVLLFHRPRLAVRGIATCLLLGSAFLAILIVQTQGRVLDHLILYNINRFELARLVPNIMEGTSEVDRGLLALGILGLIWVIVGGGLRRSAAMSPSALVRRQAVVAFAMLATLSLVATAKYGSSSAYYMQWEASLALFGGVAMALFLRTGERLWQGGRKAAGALCLALPLLTVLWTAVTTGPSHLRHVRDFQVQGDRLAPMLRAIHGPILSTEMALLLRTGHRVVWEPAIFRELAYAGRWDERGLVEKIRNHEIAAVLSDGQQGYHWFDEQFSPAIAAAMDEALPRKIHVGLRVLHLPAEPETAVNRTPRFSAPQKSPAA